jgi:hypothetical protein
VQTVKNLLKKAQKNRNTPLEGMGLSPAQILMGKRLKSKLPTSTNLLSPEGNVQIQDKLRDRELKQKSYQTNHQSGKASKPE